MRLGVSRRKTEKEALDIAPHITHGEATKTVSKMVNGRKVYNVTVLSGKDMVELLVDDSQVI